MTPAWLRVQATLSRCLRVGVHTEFCEAAARIAERGESVGERPKRRYQEEITCQRQAEALLDDIGWVTPRPPKAVMVDLSEHRPMCLSALEGQRQSYAERLDDMPQGERRYAELLIRGLDKLIKTAQRQNTE